MSKTEPKLSAWLLFIIQNIPDKKQQQLSSYIYFIEETISIWNTSHHESKMLYEHKCFINVDIKGVVLKTKSQSES